MVAIKSTSLFAASIALLSSNVHAYGQIAQVVDADNFCVFLPPDDSVDRGISDTEWNAQAFCVGSAPLAKNAGKLNSGFIQSAHYLATDQYVQVTGQIDPLKARLNATDEGGQMDIKAPKGSSCAGWKYYVNLIEPVGHTFCMRCCNDDRTCNRGISEKGCAHIIPGDYSGPYDNGGSPREHGTPRGGQESTKIKETTTTTITTKKAKKTATTTTTTITTTNPSTTTAPANEATRVPKTTTADAANVTPAASKAIAANPSAANASPSSNAAAKNNEILSQNDQVTEQSVSGADQFQPTLMALAAGIVTMAMMMMTQ